MYDIFLTALRTALTTRYGTVGEQCVATLERPRNDAHGDWSSNCAFALAKIVQNSPQNIAQAIAETMQTILVHDVVTAVGGFVNITATAQRYTDLVTTICAQGADYGTSQRGAGQKVLIEYVSANPTGPVTLGNARGGPFGDTLARVLRAEGYAVHREYYLNDHGVQIDVLGHSILGDADAQYKGAYIDTLRATLAQKGVIGDAHTIGKAAAQIVQDTLIAPALADARITFDAWFSEESLHTSGAVDAVVTALTEAGATYTQDGAVYFRATTYGDDKDRVLVKANGHKTYFCADIAYHVHKLQRADRAINIWGADHGGTVARLQGALTALGYGNRLEVLLTQFVRVVDGGVEVKMSKRRGTYITLADLVEEVGVDVTRFLFLMQAITSHVVFDLVLARERSDKNPVYYVQYAHARLVSILQKAAKQGYTPAKELQNAQWHMPQERRLIRALEDFPVVIARTAQDYGVQRLPHFAIHLADCLHAFYGACTVIERDQKEQTMQRLALVLATKHVLASVLGIIGVEAPDHMEKE